MTLKFKTCVVYEYDNILNILQFNALKKRGECAHEIPLLQVNHMVHNLQSSLVRTSLEIKAEDINKEMLKRQGGYGRGRRMQIEKDAIEIVLGVRNGYTLGSPITLSTNDDFTH